MFSRYASSTERSAMVWLQTQNQANVAAT
jgi:hypothetical protein